MSHLPTHCALDIEILFYNKIGLMIHILYARHYNHLGFEAALVYKLRILSFKKVSCNTSHSAAQVAIFFPYDNILRIKVRNDSISQIYILNTFVCSK